MVRLYDEVYLERVNELTGYLFECFYVELKMNDEEVINIVKSPLFKDLYNALPYVIGKGVDEIIFELLNVYIKKEVYYFDKEYWMGEVISYLGWYYNKGVLDILNIISLDEFRRLYYTYHEMDIRHLLDYFNNKIKYKSNLKRIRLERKLSQSKLSYLSGVNIRNIKTYEQNENDINKAQVNILLSLSKVLNCSIEDLLN